MSPADRARAWLKSKRCFLGRETEMREALEIALEALEHLQDPKRRDNVATAALERMADALEGQRG